MLWLVTIWLIAALCGFAAASVWEPALRLVVGLAGTVDPGFAAYIGEFAALGAGAETAVGWLVALTVGVPLTLLWLVVRLVMRSFGPPRHDPGDRDPRLEDRSQRPARPTPSHLERAETGRPIGSTIDVRSGSPSPGGQPKRDARQDAVPVPRGEPEPTHESTYEPSREPDRRSPPDAPRWGRQ